MTSLQFSSGDLVADRRADYAEMLLADGDASAAAGLLFVIAGMGFIGTAKLLMLGPVLVTGAAGGVGSVATAILAALVYSFVRAITSISAVIFLVSAQYNMATAYIVGLVENGEYGIAIAYSSVLIVVMIAVIGDRTVPMTSMKAIIMTRISVGASAKAMSPPLSPNPCVPFLTCRLPGSGRPCAKPAMPAARC